MAHSNTAVWSDIDIELTRQTDGDITRDTEVNAIFNSIKNIINTLQGSRRMLQPFAANASGLLFEPIDDVTARLLAESLIESIRYWEDRIEITGFDIEPIYDDSRYDCRLKFNVVGSTQTEEIKFILSR